MVSITGAISGRWMIPALAFFVLRSFIGRSRVVIRLRTSLMKRFGQLVTKRHHLGACGGCILFNIAFTTITHPRGT